MMKWKNKVWVFDEIVSKEQQEAIKKQLFSPGFPWSFVSDVSGGGSQDKRPAFSHTFIRDEIVLTHEKNLRLLEPMWINCLQKLKEKTNETANYSIIKSRTFLQLPLATVKGRKQDAHHIDLMDEHFALLYYVCDADGDTVLYRNMYSKNCPKPPEPNELKEKKRVRPKQGRVVIFDGYYWHTATQPTKGIRCIINSDVVQQK